MAKLTDLHAYDQETALAIKAVLESDLESDDAFDLVDRLSSLGEEIAFEDFITDTPTLDYLNAMRTANAINVAPRQRGRLMARLAEKGIIEVQD